LWERLGWGISGCGDAAALMEALEAAKQCRAGSALSISGEAGAARAVG